MAEKNSLMSIVTGTISTIEEHKGELFEIYDHTRAEIDVVKDRIKKTGEDLKRREQTRAKLEQEEQALKQELALASRGYSEEEIEKSYDKLIDMQQKRSETEASVERLMVEREQLITREHHLTQMFRQAEHYTLAIGSVLSYLSREIEGIAWKIDELQKEKFTGARVIKAQEEERRRISRELHDGPLQELTGLLYETVVSEKLVDRDPEGAVGSIQKLRRGIRATMGDIRQVIFDIRPMALDDQGLVGALEELCSNLRDRNVIDAAFDWDGEEYKFKKHVEVAVFRIVQEALNNAAHHSGLKKARVRLNFTNASANIIVEDKGVGFDVEDVKKNRFDDGEHFGIISMKERAGLIGAKFQINSGKNQGTRVHLKVPYEKGR
ncbi:MAG: sensor histidine kinase [Selenomonadaceae bacterium]|nr:sensor histidine kinase [Selenomonadaceae bacterium]